MPRSSRLSRSIVAWAVVSTFASSAGAQDPAPAPEAETLPTAPPTPEPAATTLLPTAPEESPPPLPRKKGLVLEATLGALGFLGQFRHVAPTGYWLHAQLGYEVLDWLMIFGEGELAFTDTSAADDPSRQRAFPIFGFGGGARATIHATERFAVYAQASIGAMKADIAKNAFAILGFRDAESLNPSFGARLGLEWYQIDRHLALGAAVGVRDAQGFAKLAQRTDTPLMLDMGVSIRYTF